jgi:hypothetical protein
MTIRLAATLFAVAALPLFAFAEDAPLTRPKAGPVQIMPLDQVKPGMKGIAWTVFQGTVPEAVPVEIMGRWKNQLGPNQDVILAKMGGKAAQTYVAGGMSGSPVYIDGKLIGAVSLRVGQFSVDAICGITPIEQMLEISEFDKSKPADAKTPEKLMAPQPTGSQSPVMGGFGPGQPLLTPIEAPLNLSGFTADTLRQFAPAFQRMGFTTVAGGGAAAPIQASKPAPGWEKTLNPGEAVAGVLVNGDMSVTGLGTVTYNDGKRVLAFGHSLFDLGPVDMPMSAGEVLMTLSSPLQPNKLANATEIVGALRQDRHSGIEGELGQESQMVPVTLKVRSLGANEAVLREKDFHFNVFVNENYTPYLMTLTLYNSLSELNEFAEESTYRLNGQVAMKGESNISVSTMQAAGQGNTPAPMALATWWGDKFSRLYLNNVKTPDVKSVNVTVDLLPERRVAIIENAWLGNSEVRAGDDVPVKVLLRPYRGEPIIKEFNVHIPVGLSKGDHRIVLSDAGTANRMQSMAGQANRFMDIPETVSLINQERSNNELYVSLVQSSPTAYDEDKTLPSLPGSALNVIQSGRAPSRSLVTSPETAVEQMALPFDSVVTGSYSLRIRVK